MRRALPIVALPVLAVLLAGCLIAPPPARPGASTTTSTTSTTTSTTSTTTSTTSTTLAALASVRYDGPKGTCPAVLFSSGGTSFTICQGSLETSVFVHAQHSTGQACDDPLAPGSKFLLLDDVDLRVTQGATTVVLDGTVDQVSGPFHRWNTGLDIDDGPVQVTLQSFTVSNTAVCFD